MLLLLSDWMATPGIVYFLLPCCHRLENRLVLEIWIVITQMKIIWVGCARSLSEASWLSILEHLFRSSEVFNSLPAVAVSKESHT